MTMKMNWGKGFYYKTRATPTPDISISLLDHHEDRYTHFDVHVTDVQGTKNTINAFVSAACLST